MPTNLDDLKQRGVNKKALEVLAVRIYIQKSGRISPLCSFHLFWGTPLQLSLCIPSFPHFWARGFGRSPGMLTFCQLEAKISSCAGPADVTLVCRLALNEALFLSRFILDWH